MSEFFDQNRAYVLGDPDLNIIGDREKLSQWRHKQIGPAYYRLGRKIIYRGADLNSWVEASRVDPSKSGRSSLVDPEPHVGQKGLADARTRIKAP